MKNKTSRYLHNYILPSLGRGLGVGLLLLFSLSSFAKNQGKELSGLLLSYLQIEDVHPDSLESNIANLKQKRLQCKDPAEKAVYAAALAKLYCERRYWRSVGEDLNDSMVCWYGIALADKALLAETKARKWKGFVNIGKDEGYYGGDMLNVIWRSMASDVDRSVRDTSQVLPKRGEIIEFYRNRGLRTAALLLAMDGLYDRMETVRHYELKSLIDEYGDLQLCAEVYLHLGTQSDQTLNERREWLKQGIARYPKYKRRSVLQNTLTRMSDPKFDWSGTTWAYPGKQYRWVFTARNVQSVLIDGKEHKFAEHDPIETFNDTVYWTAPASGDHVITFVPVTDTKVNTKILPLKQRIRVSSLQALYQVMPDNQVRILVVDSETGKAQSGVTVNAYEPYRKDSAIYFTGRTNQNGRLIVPRSKDKRTERWQSQFRFQLSTPVEQNLPINQVYLSDNDNWKGAPKDSTVYIEVFTDRAIYRPGQTVHVSGISFSQLDWEARASNGGLFLLRLYDSNRKEVETKKAEADDMGVFSTDFVIPKVCRNGYFTIEVNGREKVQIRVEEYKRPTFEVVLDDSLRFVGDTCEVHGRATNYDGTPLRGARVTGTYLWHDYWIYRRHSIKNEKVQLDTLETDDNGCFVYKVGIKDEKLNIDYSRSSLLVNVDVLSQHGETHNTSHLYWRLKDHKPQPQSQQQPQRIDSTFVVRSLVGKFSPEKPGRIEVLTNLRDVYVYYTLTAAGRVWKDETLRLNNESFVIEIPYDEAYDQSLTATFCMVKAGNVYTRRETIYLAKPDLELKPHWDTFRDLLQPGQKEEWKLTLRRPDGTPADASLMVAMYDASLDYFNYGNPHRWNFSRYLGHRTFDMPYSMVNNHSYSNNTHEWYYQKLKKERDIAFTEINLDLFRTHVYTRATGGRMYKLGALPERMLESVAMPMMVEKSSENDVALQGKIAGLDLNKEESKETEEEGEEEKESLSVPMRENFNETAFFMPQLRTDKNGQVSISFTLPESLTRWNFIGVAHTSDMLYANLNENIEARKDLMAQLYLPRFLRPGDEAMLTATVRNVCDQPQKGRGLMQILDAKTEKVLKSWKTDIRLEAQRDTVLHFPYSLTSNLSPLTSDLIVRWAVEGTTCSDGEQRLLPVLPATQHITNTIAITAYDPSVQNIDLTGLFPKNVSNRQLTVEYTTHPEQYALQALPALARTKREDVLSLAVAYYAGFIGKCLGANMVDSTEIYLEKLRSLQDDNGGFRWYPGMTTSPYLTCEVSYLLTRLNMLTGKKPAAHINTKAVHYLLSQRIDSTYLSLSDLRYLYIAQYSGVQLSKDEQKKVNFLLKLAKREDVEEDGYERQALLAIILKQAGADRKAKKCAKEFRKYLVSSPDRGTYIEFPKGSFTSIDRKLHIHVQLMEALQRMNPEDTLLRGMRRYLLQQKRTQDWKTPVNSANAVFALLSNSNSETQDSKIKDVLTLTRQHSKQMNFVAEDDTLGYLCDTILIEEGKLPQRLRLQKSTKGESWGGIFADFEQPFSEVKAHSAGLTITQEYPKEARTGSRYTVRYRITADRDYEYVTLVVPRPAFTEPVDMRSGYRWSNSSPYGWTGFLGFYRQVHDATTEFSFCQIPRGEYLIEETLYVERDGRYHSGVAVIRCEYAEEFQGHSDDCVVEVK